MQSNPRLNQSIKQTLERLPVVISDIEARPDFNDNPAFATDIGLLNDFKQALLIVSIAPSLPMSVMAELQSSAEFTVLPLLEHLIIANVAITKMGQLNTNRSISPAMATQHNVNLVALQNAVQTLVACLTAALMPPPPPVEGRLLRLEVSGADEIGDGQYAAEYAQVSVITIRAVVEPSVPSVFESLIWEGGEAGYANDYRLLPRDRISRPDQPMTVAAWLGNTRLRIAVTVRPLLGGLDVSNSVKIGDRWIAHYAADGQPIVVRAAMMPNNADAYRYLSWKGGSVDFDHPYDRRLVPRNAMTPPGKPVSVAARLNPKYEVEIEVVPRFTALIVSTESGIVIPASTSGNTSHYAIPYGNGAISISAVTEPASEEAWSHLVWTGNAAATGQANIKTLARNALSPFGQAGYTITATVGDTTRTAVIQITPTLVSMQVSTVDRIIDAIMAAGNVSNYSVSYALKQNVTVTVTTDPDDKAAWAYIAWTGDGTHGSQANRRILARNVLTPFGQAGYSVKATVSGTALVARIKVTPTLKALTIPVYGFDTGVAQQWYSYQLVNPNVFNISAPIPKAVVRAETVPDTAAAWAYIAWADNGNPNQVEAGVEARLRTVRLDAANTVSLSATVGGRQLRAQLDIRAPRQWPSDGPQLAIDNITFSGGRAVTIDYATGSTLAKLGYCRHFPRIWHRANPGTAQEYPQSVLYQPPQTYTRNTPIGIAADINVTRRPKIDADNTPIRASAYFRRSGGQASRLGWQQEVNIPAVGSATVIFPDTNSAKLPDVILHEDQLLVFWELNTGGQNWTLFDITEHCIYVTLENPVTTAQNTLNDPAVANAAYTLWTMLDISCAAGKETADDAGAAFGIYSAFHPENPNIKLKRKHDGVLFKYWHPCPGAAQHLTATPVGTVAPQLLIADGSGSSLSFAEMLMSMFGIHGIDGARLIEVKPNPAVSAEAVRFLMRNWTFNAPPYANGTAYTHFMNNDGKAKGIHGSNAGWATWSPGAGQNSLTPPAAFQNHFLVRLQQIGIDIFFDPSYGSAPFANWLSWVSESITGLERPGILKPTGQWYRFLAPPAPVKQPNAGFVKQNPYQLPVVFAERTAGA